MSKIRKHIQAPIMHHNTVPSVSDAVLLDTQDLLLRMHVSRGTLLRWRNRGLLTYSKIGGKIYYRESDLIKLFDKHKVG